MRMRRYKRQESYPRNSGILLPIVGMVAFVALGYFIGDSIQKAHYIAEKKQLEMKVKNLEQQLDYFRFEVGLASGIKEHDLPGRYRMMNQSDPNLEPASLKRLIWPIKYRPYVNQPISSSQD